MGGGVPRLGLLSREAAGGAHVTACPHFPAAQCAGPEPRRVCAGWRGTGTVSLPRVAPGMGGAGAAHGEGRALAGEAPSGRSHRMHGLGQEWGLELDLHRVPLSVREVAGPRLWRQLGFLGELTWQTLSPGGMLGVSEDTHLSLAGEPLGTAAGCGASAVNCPAGTHSQPAPGSGWRRAPWTPKSGRPCFCAFWPEMVHGFHPALRGPVTPSEAPTQGPCPQGASAGGGRRGGAQSLCHLLMFLNFALLYFLPPDNKSPACACPVLAY